jgi:hypothetical protein
LKSTLKSAYKIVRVNSRKSHDTYKRYYERKAKERSFQPVENVYVFNPTRKPGQSSNFFSFGKELTRSQHVYQSLNYRVVFQQGKNFVVTLNCMKRAIKEEIWKAGEIQQEAAKKTAGA